MPHFKVIAPTKATKVEPGRSFASKVEASGGRKTDDEHLVAAVVSGVGGLVRSAHELFDQLEADFAQQRPAGAKVSASDREIVESWGRPGGPVSYRLVSRQEVRQDVREAAEAGRDFAAAQLRITPPTMRFYLPGRSPDGLWFDGPNQNGHADRSTRTIGVRADISAALAVEVAAHEVFHLTQSGLRAANDEREALAYGKWAADRMLTRQGKLRRLFLCEKHPHLDEFAGDATPDDVLVDNEGGVWWNDGTTRDPFWRRDGIPPQPGRAA